MGELGSSSLWWSGEMDAASAVCTDEPAADVAVVGKREGNDVERMGRHDARPTAAQLRHVTWDG
jgi:hypothetical protein